MRQLAMGAVDLAPLVVERHDNPHLVVEQPTGGIARRGSSPSSRPSARPHLAELELPARSPPAPTGVGGHVEQIQQARLGGLVHSPRDPATQSQCPFLSLDQHELDGHLLEGLAQPDGIGSGRL